jgi:hypothetical protein
VVLKKYQTPFIGMQGLLMDYNMYEVATVLSRTGVPHEVDHIVPLRSKIVQGFHTHDNMQVLARWQNRSKGARLWQ